jgi:hypothetical protein
MKRLILMSLSLLAGAASAQTYDFDVVFNPLFEGGTVVGAPINTITGSFTYANGAVTSFNVPDPPFTEPQGTAPTQFTVLQTAPNAQAMDLNFFDLEGAPSLAAAGSNVWTFGFEANGLGTANANIDSAYFYHDGHSEVSCGPDYTLYTCSVKTLTEVAPEMNAGSAASTLTLLFGSLAVMRGRRRDSHSRNGLNDSLVLL